MQNIKLQEKLIPSHRLNQANDFKGESSQAYINIIEHGGQANKK